MVDGVSGFRCLGGGSIVSEEHYSLLERFGSLDCELEFELSVYEWSVKSGAEVPSSIALSGNKPFLTLFGGVRGCRCGAVESIVVHVENVGFLEECEVWGDAFRRFAEDVGREFGYQCSVDGCYEDSNGCVRSCRIFCTK